MGEVVIVMKKFFAKDSFILSTFNKKQSVQSLVVSLLLMFMFVFSAFTFMNMLYAFADCIGSIVCASMDVALKDLLRSLPLFFSFFMSLWTLFMLHDTLRNSDNEKRLKSTFVRAIVILALAGVSILYVIIGRIVGKYSSLVEGSPSALYPLDSILYSLLFVAIGVFAIIYVKKLQAKLPYEAPSRGPIVKKVRWLYCLGMVFWLMIALFGFAASILGLFIVDFVHGYQFFSVSIIFCFALPFILLMFWEFYFNELTEENKKAFALPLALVSVGLSVLAMVLYFVSLAFNLDAPSNIGFGIFPVAFAASVNIATMVVVITPFIVSLIALIKALVGRKAK